jgi:cyclic pyranopterin phosphate synthase
LNRSTGDGAGIFSDDRKRTELIDPHGRRVNYLRLSVTDRCNLRCSYCMPAEGARQRRPGAMLGFEELYRIATVATELGIEKIRITGGEPLVRRGIVDFLARLSSLPRLKELVLTTNGTLLPAMADELRDAGVARLNISLDSLEPETFARITRQGRLDDVLAGIEAAGYSGLPVKINTVIMRGVNDGEIPDFIRMTLDQALSVRFIEYMPVIKAPDWQSLVLTGQQILARITCSHQVEELAAERRCGPARMFRVKGARGSFGLITPLSGHFCAQCNRIRISAAGHASSCLFSDRRIDVRAALQGDGNAPLVAVIRELIGAKPARRHVSTAQAPHLPFAMSQIGG